MQLAAPSHLRCECFENPIGIDAPRPRLSWWMNDPRPGAKQSAYQIVVSDALSGATLWDSGRVDSDKSVHVDYAGESLRSRQRCEWKVRLWNEVGEASPWSEPATF